LLYGDSSRARKDLEWQPKTDFTGLVTKMVKHDLELAKS
jgi:GDP-D-mannose dehydratase